MEILDTHFWDSYLYAVGLENQTFSRKFLGEQGTMNKMEKMVQLYYSSFFIHKGEKEYSKGTRGLAQI